MNELQIRAIKTYFDREIAQCKELEKTLVSDSRPDEAVFSKVQQNVYDIFRTIFSTALRLHCDDGNRVKEFFLEKTEQIPLTWKTSLQTAEEHGNFEKAYIERIKLDAIDHIKNAFEELWEANYD